jgi:hypothetical protein
MTARDRPIVQEWFHEDLDEDNREDIRGRVAYLANVPQHLWLPPHFKHFGNRRGELRGANALRIYGWFRDDEHFLFLNGEVKEKNHDRRGMRTAELRLKEFLKDNGSFHEFDFKERSD